MKTISISEFVPMLNDMAQVWPTINAQARGKRYFSAIADLEADIVKNFCNHFMDTFHKMPLPSDFLEASRLFKRDYFDKFGQYYGDTKKSAAPQSFRPDCYFCFDSGYEWIAIEGIAAFCFCICKSGDTQQRDSNWILPKSSELSGIQRKNFPIKAFMPRDPENYNLKDLENFDPVVRWKNAVTESQEFWKQYYSRKKA